MPQLSTTYWRSIKHKHFNTAFNTLLNTNTLTWPVVNSKHNIYLIVITMLSLSTLLNTSTSTLC